MADNEQIDSENISCPNFVEIKSEPLEYNVDIKVEPPDEGSCDKGYEENSAAKLSVDNVTIKCDKEDELYPKVETITVKIEPTFYSSEDEYLADYQNSQETYQQSSQTYISGIHGTPQLRKIKKTRKGDPDEDYIPRKKKKVNEVVKKTYTTKAKKKENCYSENVTKHIELVTISEEERQIEFKELWQSRKHMRYTCRDCAVGFVMEEPYLAHMKNHAPEAGEWECPLCRCRLRSAARLYKHRLRHRRRYRCALCRRVHKDKETAASHVMSEHIHEAFTCDQCGKGFKRPAYLKKHIQQQHTRGQKHECPICARVFFDTSMFKTHFRRHNEEVRNPVKQMFICDTCCRQFKSKPALKRHLLVHARARTLACPRCPAMFQTRRGLRLHELNKHTDQGERALHPCPACARACTTAPLLRQHVRRMHTDRTKRYQCDHCKRFYYTKGEVRAHIVWSHAPSRGERALFCRECGREFRTRTRLRDHIAVHHLRVERQRVHKCDQCEKAFANKQVLNRHKKSHSNFTYPCPVCGVRFKCEAYVKVHHQLKHLNMTRAQIKAQKQSRTNARIVLPQSEPEDLSVKTNVSEICFEKVIVKEEIQSDSEISAPLFDLVDLKMM